MLPKILKTNETQPPKKKTTILTTHFDKIGQILEDDAQNTQAHASLCMCENTILINGPIQCFFIHFFVPTYF